MTAKRQFRRPPPHRATSAASRSRPEPSGGTDGGRTALLILGMHRSGTSAFTRVAGLLGAALPEDLMPPAADNNEAGFWESVSVWQLNDAVLESAGSAWDDWRAFNRDWFGSPLAPPFRRQAAEVLERGFGNAPLIALKDPRICRLLPFWLEVLAERRTRVLALLPLRHPMEVAASLRRRDGFAPPKSWLLWLRHVLEAESGTRGLPRAFADYPELLDDWRGTMRRVQQGLDLRWPRWSAAAEVGIDAFLSDRLRHNATPPDELAAHPEIPVWVKTTHAALRELIRQPDSSAALAMLDRVRDEFDQASLAFGAVLRAEELGRSAAETLAATRQARLDTVAAELAARTDQAERLQGELTGGQAHIAELDARIAEQSAHAEQLSAERARIGDQLNDILAVNRTQSAQIGRLTGALSERDAHLERLKSEHTHLAAEYAHHVETLESECAARDTRISQLAAERTELQNQNAGLRQQLQDQHRHSLGLDRIRERQLGELESLRTLADRHLGRAARSERHQGELAARLQQLQTSAAWQLARPFRTFERRFPRAMHRLAAVPRFTWWTLSFRLPSRLRRRAEWRRILASGLFHEVWYRETYPEVLRSGQEPLLHWTLHGWRAGQQPHPLFDTAWYLARNPDVARAGMDPLLHYVAQGAGEGRAPHPLFDTAWYLAHAPDVAAAGLEPLAHFLRRGALERRDPHPLFDTAWYLERNPDVAQAGINPLKHFVWRGASERRAPHPLFDTAWYLARYPDVAAAGVDPLRHYLEQGASERRNPHPLFDTAWYLTQVPELLQTDVNPLVHYLTQGAAEGRDPHPLFDTDWYLERNPEARPPHGNPLRHYLTEGAAQGRDPHPLFDSDWYRRQHAGAPDAGFGNPLVHYLETPGWLALDPHPACDGQWYRNRYPETAGTHPLLHYLTQGAAEGRDPHPLFRTRWYLQQYPQVTLSGRNPLVDYLLDGVQQGRDPGPGFDTDWYLDQNPDIRQSNPFVHYLLAGQAEGRPPHPRHTAPAPETGVPPAPDGGRGMPPRSDPPWQGDWSVLLPASTDPPERVLVIDWKPPTPDLDSGSYRMSLILELLRDAGFQVDFIGDRAAERPDYATRLQERGSAVVIGRQAALEHLVRHGDRYRTVLISRPEVAADYLPMVRAHAPQARTLYDTVDLHWVRFERGAAFAPDPAELLAHARHYRSLELANASAADLTIAITAEEAERLRQELPGLETCVVPNIHPVAGTIAPLAARRDLFFIGGFDHLPNVDAMRHFAADILPPIHAELPEVRLRIVGSRMPDVIRELAGPAIEPVGYVNDIDPYFAGARVFVAPLRHGAGMKGKIGQSLSHGLPVVTTAIGAEGIGLVHETHALIADLPDAFAAAVVRLYRDDDLWHRLSAAGLALIRQQYSKEAAARALLPLFD